MADFDFNLLTHSPSEKRVISTALGAAAGEGFLHKEDFGKAVKMGALANHVLCGADDEIEGFIDSVRGDTVNDGFSFGGVSRGGRHQAVIGAGQGGVTAAVVLDYVVGDVQAVAGVEGPAVVKTGAPTTHKWRIINLMGDGFAGSTVILERDE